MLAAAGAAALAGCGGGGDARLSATEYRAQLSKLGQGFLSEVRRDEQSFGAARTAAARSSSLERLRGSFARLADRVEALDPPSAGQGAQDRLVKRLDGAATAVVRYRSALEGRDRRKVTTTMAELEAGTGKVTWAIDALYSDVGGQPPSSAQGAEAGLQQPMPGGETGAGPTR